MSLGESKMSKYGGVSELEGRLTSISGDVAATEASFDRKGSLGFIGGIGILALLSTQTVLLRQRRLNTGNDGDEHKNDDAIGTRKPVTITSQLLQKIKKKKIVRNSHSSFSVEVSSTG